MAVLSLVGVLFAGCGADRPSGAATPGTGASSSVEANAIVDRIVDGDTIIVFIDDGRERVRLTGIDTPEIAHPANGTREATPGECFGDEATSFTESLLDPGTPVRLERDVVGRDDYGRLLAYVYRASDGLFVNYEIVRQGYAQPLTIPPNVTFADLMVQAAREAESDDVGLWSACN
jgi:micrococcal nuclease